MRRRPGRGSKAALAAALAALTSDPAGSGPPGVGPLGAVVDCVVAARRMVGWSLWVELAGLAQLLAFWESHPPLTDPHLYDQADPVKDQPDGLDGEGGARVVADPDLADRLACLIGDLQLPADVHLGDLAELFVTSEISAATGASRTATGTRVDAARALFLTDRLPRTRTLLRAGLLDWTKLRTLLTGTADLHPDVARAVEGRLIPDTDLALAAVDPLDVRADPAHPGATLPTLTRITNPALERALRAAVAAIDADALAERAARARTRRHVRGYPTDDSMARLEIEAAQEAVAAVLNDLDATAAAAKAAGDTRTPDQIRTDTAINRLTRGTFSTPTTPDQAADEPGQAADPDQGPGSDQGENGTDQTEQPEYGDADNDTDNDTDNAPGPTGLADPRPPEPAGDCLRCGSPDGQFRSAGPGMAVSLTMTLSTWLGLAEDPAVLDRYGAIPAALARQIAREAARDHPTTTTWRCVITGDDHRSIVAAANPMRTPHHDPPPRLARLVDTIHPTCVFPGCPQTARRCDHDHRTPYEDGGATCSCNLQPLCRTHHRLKSVGLITAHPIADDPTGPDTDAIAWTTASGRSYRYDAPPPVPEPADRHDQSLARVRHKQHHREQTSTGSDRDGHDADGDITTGEDLSWRDLTRPRPAASRPSHNASHDTDGAVQVDCSISVTWDDPPPF